MRLPIIRGKVIGLLEKILQTKNEAATANELGLLLCHCWKSLTAHSSIDDCYKQKCAFDFNGNREKEGESVWCRVNYLLR